MEIIRSPRAEGRRYKVLRIHRDAFELFVTGNFFEVVEGIPKDAKILDIRPSFIGNGFDVCVESAKFPIVLYGREPEAMDVKIKIYSGPELQTYKRFIDSAAKV